MWYKKKTGWAKAELDSTLWEIRRQMWRIIEGLTKKQNNDW